MPAQLRSRIVNFQSTLLGRIFTNAGWVSSASVITLILGIVQTGILARLLGPQGVGVLGLFMALRALSVSLFSLNSSEAVMVYTVRAISLNEPEVANGVIRNGYITDLATSLIAFLILAIMAMLLPNWLKIPENYRPLLLLYAATVVFNSGYGVSNAILRVAGRFSWTFVAAVVIALLKVLTFVIVWKLHGRFFEVILTLVLTELCSGLLYFYLAKRALGTMNLSFQAGKWQMNKEILKFQLTGYGRQVFKSLNNSVDTLMIGYLTNTVQVGFYRAGTQIVKQMQIPAQSMVTSLFPEYSRLWFEGRTNELRKLILRLLCIFGGVGALAATVIWFGAETFVRIIFGEKFLPATDTIRILFISGFALLVISPVYSFPVAIGKPAITTWTSGAALLVQVIVLIWLAPGMGAIGAAWSNVAYFATWSIMILPTTAILLRRPKEESAQLGENLPHSMAIKEPAQNKED